MESKLKSPSKYFHNKLSCQLRQRHLKQGDTWRREKRNCWRRDPPEPSSPGRVAAWWTPNWLIPSSLFIENYQCRQLPISMGFAVTCLSSLSHSFWIIDSLQFCEFSVIVFHFPAPPHPIAMWTNSLNCPKKSNLCDAQLQLKHIYSYIYSCRYICICEIRRTLRGHSPSAAAIRLMSSSTTGDGQQKRRQLLDQAKCRLSPSASDPSPCCFCVCVCVATKQKNLSTFQHIGRGKTNTASILSLVISLSLSLPLSRKLPINNFRHNFQLENSAKMFNEYKIEIELNKIVFWFDFRLKMTKFADIDDDLRAEDVVEIERQIEIQLSITWPHSPPLLYFSLPNFLASFLFSFPGFPSYGSPLSPSTLYLLPILPLLPFSTVFSKFIYLFCIFCFLLPVFDFQMRNLIVLFRIFSNFNYKFCTQTWDSDSVVGSLGGISYSRYTVSSCTWGSLGSGGSQAGRHQKTYQVIHTRVGALTHTHTCTGTHSGAQHGVCFCFSENCLRYFPKFFLLLLLFCLAIFFAFLFVFFFLVYAFGRSAANATERFSVRRVSVGKSKRKAKLKMEIRVRQQQQQQ